jgi:uncharacterized repeat protein (TIGR03803 family)
VKKIILAFLLICSLLVNAQPKLVTQLSYGGTGNGGALARHDLPGTTPGVIYSFNNLSPHMARTGVVAGNEDWLYGVLAYNGVNSEGCLYKVRSNGLDFTLLHDSAFNVTPYYHTDGMIYFHSNLNIVKLDPLTNAKTFLPANGFLVSRNLLIDANDWIYYTTFSGIVKMKTDGSEMTDLHFFNPPVEGSSIAGGLTEAADDDLFGVHTYEGVFNGGTLYSIKKDGTGFTVHHQFTTATGIYPESKLVYFDGKLYGTTSQGGDHGMGVLFAINADGSDYRVLRHFDQGLFSTGGITGNISITSNGRIIGSFLQFYAQSFLYSRLYKIDTSGDNFQPFCGPLDRSFGNMSRDPLVINDETIFTVTAEGGRYEGGVLGQWDTTGSGGDLYNFGYSSTGFYPRNGLARSINGKLYGTNTIGGTSGNGNIYSMNADGTGYTVLHSFTDNEGYDPIGKLLEASDGKLYGACQYGGPLNSGCIYRIDKTGSNFEIIYDFSVFANGYTPQGSLVEDAGGSLYGTTTGGSANTGVVFRINKDGSNYTVLRTFDASGIYAPVAGLALSSNFLYGICSGGGSFTRGGLFRIRTDGSGYEVLHEFGDGTDGYFPFTTPIIATNGKLYGTAGSGGTDFGGILYSIDTDGNNYTTLKNFSYAVDGSAPYGDLIQASDGLLYGSLFSSNISLGGAGAIYRFNLDGSGFNILKEYNFETEGGGPRNLIDLNGTFVLPVEFISFEVTKKEHSVLLTWKTAQEQNSDRFEIERSSTGTGFSSIGRVTAAGNSTITKSYSFTDNNPFYGMNYYRLKQIDIDGKFIYSKTISVRFDDPARLVISPNPASNHLNIRILTGNNYAMIRIFDASGRPVLQKNIAGSSTVMQVDIQYLAKGWYVLQLEGDKSQYYKFLKQ